MGNVNLAVKRNKLKQKADSGLHKDVFVEIEVALTSYSSKPSKPHSLVMRIERLLEFIPQPLLCTQWTKTSAD